MTDVLVGGEEDIGRATPPIVDLPGAISQRAPCAVPAGPWGV